MKRLFDLCASAIGLVLLLPFLPLVALAIRLEGGGPVFFRQTRVGRQFRPFRILKFRTMVVGAEQKGPGITPAGDARVTRVGALLRRLKLDELPQLWNVFVGDMSFVGPRPELPHYVQRFPDEFRTVLQVRPGITDLASLLYRDEAAILGEGDDPEKTYLEVVLPEKLRLARDYVAHASFLHDLHLVAGTVLTLFYPADRVERGFDRAGRLHEPFALVAQCVLVILANLAAVKLSFNGAPPAAMQELAMRALPVLVLARLAGLWALRLDRDMWQYVGARELERIVASVALSSALFAGVAWGLGEFPRYPQAAFVVDAALCIMALGGVRFARRLHAALAHRLSTARRVLVIGNGDPAEQVVRGLLSHPKCNYQVVGLVGDDAASVGLHMHSVPVVGCVEQLEPILSARAPDDVVIVSSTLRDGQRRETVRRCRAAGASVRVVPDLDSLLARRDLFSRLGESDAEDLLMRSPTDVDLDGLHQRYAGRTVLVTGAGGSIGSEIARQVASCAPRRLVLFEKHEEALYHIENELVQRWPGLHLDPVLGDIRDPARVEETFAATRPGIVFHAAAYKHVPMLEKNPGEAFKTNVIGTRILADAAIAAGVGRFVNVSTDKAVEPVSVLGATKRMAELLIQNLAGTSRTRFQIVRFGNVLESSGSVVPRFKRQIERGEPVTVTHADATRWFMTVPEAVQLILEAANLGKGGEVFVLDMGKPIRIVDLAHALIRQYGLTPGRDVPVVFTGLRPGERLFEKLFNDHEAVWKTAHPRILMAAEANADHGTRRVEEFVRLLQFVQAARGESDDRAFGAPAGGAPARTAVASDLSEACA